MWFCDINRIASCWPTIGRLLAIRVFIGRNHEELVPISHVHLTAIGRPVICLYFMVLVLESATSTSRRTRSWVPLQ
jgi:hypothetical protein